MSPTSRLPFEPDYTFPPGETLRDRLVQLGLSQIDLAQRSGLSAKHINQIIQGTAPITYETALVLERVTGTPAAVWNKLEATHREALLRAKQRTLSPLDEDWVAFFPIKELQRRNRVPRVSDKGALYEALLSFFAVADRAAWERVWSRPAADFKRATTFLGDPGAMAAWLRIGELEAKKINTRPFNAVVFRKALQQVRTLTRSDDFSDQLVEICAAAGVAVVFVREIGKTRVSGAAWWASPTRAVIQVSDRYKSDDSFWFAFFHEAAHVLLHSKKETFIDVGTESEHDALEVEANQFAANTLIPPQFARELPSISTHADIERFAEKVGVSPGVVVGRLHHDGLWAWRKGNQLRRRLQVVDEE